MATLKEEANTYEAPQTKNIAELDKFSVDLELHDGEGKDGDGEVFKYKFIVVDGKSYRVPGTVIGGVKALMTKLPNLKEVTVLKTGERLNTRYQVIPYQS